jgi:hypothetical protein
MVAQDQDNSTKLQVDIVVEVQGQDPLDFLPLIEAIEDEPHPNENAEHILQLQEELHRVRARIGNKESI